MNILQIISEQMQVMKLPLYAVTVAATPRPDTPLLLILHWHGFLKHKVANLPNLAPLLLSVPGSVLQINNRWQRTESLDASLLDAAWQLGAWDLQRNEHRSPNHIGAPQQETLECMKAFGKYIPEDDSFAITEAPDQEEMLSLAKKIGYVQWQFRPVFGGIWKDLAEDNTLNNDGKREPPCPLMPEVLHGGKHSHFSYRLGRIERIILP